MYLRLSFNFTFLRSPLRFQYTILMQQINWFHLSVFNLFHELFLFAVSPSAIWLFFYLILRGIHRNVLQSSTLFPLYVRLFCYLCRFFSQHRSYIPLAIHVAGWFLVYIVHHFIVFLPWLCVAILIADGNLFTSMTKPNSRINLV